MNLKSRICLSVLALMVAGCVDSESGDAAFTSTSGSAEVATSESTTTSTESTVVSSLEPETDVFRIAPVGEMPGLAILYGTNGVFHPGHTGFSDEPIVDGPVSSAVDTYDTGIVYQRPGDNRRAFIRGEEGDQELLVADENQTIRLVGVRSDPVDETPHILYIRRISSTPEDTTETLRSYNMASGEVVEIYQTGGWESGTDFSYIEQDRVVGLWSGEGSTRTDIVNVATGEIEQSFPAEGECFDAESGEGCLPFATSELTELISFPWDNGLYYPVEMWLFGGAPGKVIVGLSSTPHHEDGSPLPALIYDTETGEATTAPVSGYFRGAYIS